MNSIFIQLLLIALFAFSSIESGWSQVIKDATKIVVDVNGRKTTEITLLIQVNDKQSNYLSHIEIRHSPKQEFSFRYARVLDGDGNILRKLKKKDLTTRSNLSYSTFYQDDLITEFDLYWNQFPYRIEYSYTIAEEEFIYIAGWTPFVEPNVSTIESSLEINVPHDYKINIHQSKGLSYKESKTDEKKIYYWESSYAEKTKEEIYSPPFIELIPKVIVVPSQFKYGIRGSSESWSSFGLWLNQLNEGTDELPLSERNIVEQLINGIDDKKEIIKKIYYYLQDHTRYVNVDIGVGGLKSYPASYVCKNKYGDCKALTTYMKSMLKSVNIESYSTVINAGMNKEQIEVDFPSQQFNHVILVVPLENDTVYLENTSDLLPFNYLGTFTQGRYALVVNGGKSKLIQTPKLYPADVLVERENIFTCTEKKNGTVDIALTLRGSDFEKMRYFLANGDELDQKKEVIRHLDIIGFKVHYWETIENNRDCSYIKINVSGESSELIREIGSWKVINPLKINVPEFEEPNERHLDVRINYPINKFDKSVYEFNFLDVNRVQIPEGVNMESIYGQYFTSYILENNKVIVHEKFTLLDNNISVDQYTEFYSFIQSIFNHKKKSAIIIK